ncbi:hypothetical protein [Clostridium saccharoperbutylacetonicum]|uniref:hypothetical protein n=1 Tax=Clostridium saccharoperbutylacetonicum TaxID=36745 RepID=UPI0039EAA79F
MNNLEYIKVNFNFTEPLIDRRINGRSWMAKMTIGDYLKMIDLDGNIYQRSLQSLSFYQKLIQDLLNDTTMPPISVVYPDESIDFEKGLDKRKQFIILDGLQRTNCIIQCKRLIEEGKSKGVFKTVEEFENKYIYIEIWEKLELRNILYKMVVLNTGQKKMDYDHQLDILSSSIKTTLDEMDINYYCSKEKDDFKGNNEVFSLSLITSGLVSFINKSPIRNKKNAAEFLFNNFNLDIEAGDTETTLKLINSEDTYKYMEWVLIKFNKMLDEKYGIENPLKRYDVFMVSLFASLGFCYDRKPELLKKKIVILEKLFEMSEDPLKMKQFEAIYKTFKTGIGDKRRKFTFGSLRRYFMDDILDDEFRWEKEYAEL